MRSKVVIGFLLFLLIAMALPAGAQETTGTITGFVKDSSGAVIPNVQVIVLNVSTGLERRVTTGTAGEYTATLLPVGAYEIHIEHAGFQKFIAKAIALNVNDRLRVDATLKVGAASEVMTVEATTPFVQTEHSAVGAVITGTQVLNTPLNGRSLYQLMALQPGMMVGSNILSGRVGYGLDATNAVSVNGARAAQTNFLIDGGDNVDTGSNLAVINYISIDAVNEFKILRGNYNAEFGRSAGGQVNVVTRGGGNQFHGSAYEYWRNDILDARPYFKPSCDTLRGQGITRIMPGVNCGSPLLRYNDFGGTIGGPIKKDKLFFFYSEEVRRVRQVRGTGVINTRVPTALEKAGDFSKTFAGGKPVVIVDPLTCDATGKNCTQFSSNGVLNVIPPDRIDPSAKALLGIWPDPNGTPAVLGGDNNYTVSTPASRNYREELLRVDWNISQKHSIFGRMIQDTMPSVEPFNEVFGGINADLPNIFATNTKLLGKNLVAEWNWIPNSNMVNNFAFNYSKGAIFSTFTGEALRSNFPGFTTPEVFPDNIAGALPAVGVGGYASWGQLQGGPFGPYFNTYGSHRIKDTLAWNKGKHALKFGYLFSWEFKNEDNGGSVATAGSFQFPTNSTSAYFSSGNGFANFLLGRASSYSESNIDMMSFLRYSMHEAFVQDDWKVLPNLTLNLGARWSYILPPTDAKNRLTNFVPALFDPAKAMQVDASGNRIPGTGDPLNGVIVAGVNSPWGNAVVESHPNTVGPRIGFAWDPWKDGKTSVRGGYGIYFDRTLSGIALQNAFLNPPFVTAASFSANSRTNVPTLANPAGGAAKDQSKVIPSLTAMAPNFMIPTTQHWSFGIQRELPGGVSMDLAYVGNHGTHLLRALRINQTHAGAVTSTNAAYPIANYRGWGTITVRDTSASSRYDSLQLGLNKKVAHGLQFGMAYTWAKTLTDAPDDRTTQAQDFYNLRAERSLANFNKAHVFVFNWIYDLPFYKNAGKTMYNLLGGWQIGGLYRLETGTPLTMTASGAVPNAFFGGGTVRLNLVGDPNGARTEKSFFNTAAFAFPATNTWGNAPRSIVTGPGINLADLSLNKNFKTTERIGLRFRADLFNAFNHTNFSGVATAADVKILTGAANSGTPQFGQVTSALAPREIQLSLKLTF